MSDTMQETTSIPETPLQKVIKQGQVSLGSTVNLGIGASRVADGIMIHKPNPLWFAFNLDMVAPQWLPVDLRHPLTLQTCREMEDPVMRVHCENLLDIKIARKKCPQTAAIEIISNNLLGEIRDTYKDALNPAINVQLLEGICARYPGLCSTVKADGYTPYAYKTKR